jgi:hypothetical protein
LPGGYNLSRDVPSLHRFIAVAVLLASPPVLTVAGGHRDVAAGQQAARKFSDGFVAAWIAGKVPEVIDKWFVTSGKKDRQRLEADLRWLDEQCGSPLDAVFENNGIPEEYDTTEEGQPVHEFMFMYRASTTRAANLELGVGVSLHRNGQYSIGANSCQEISKP